MSKKEEFTCKDCGFTYGMHWHNDNGICVDCTERAYEEAGEECCMSCQGTGIGYPVDRACSMCGGSGESQQEREQDEPDEPDYDCDYLADKAAEQWENSRTTDSRY